MVEVCEGCRWFEDFFLRDTLQQNKILRVINKNLVQNRFEVFAETANENDEYKKFSKQFGKCLKSWKSIVEQITDVHVPQIMEEIVEMAKIVQQVNIQQRTVEEIVDVLEPQFLDDSVEVVMLVSQEHILCRDRELTVCTAAKQQPAATQE